MPIYLTQSFPGGEPGHVKIGYSKTQHSLVMRMMALQTGHPAPLRLIAVADVGREWEQWLHELLARHNVRGEWFVPHQDVRDAFYAVDTLGRVMRERIEPPDAGDGQLRLRVA
jgi:Meiotically up-regulated gene 113